MLIISKRSARPMDRPVPAVVAAVAVPAHYNSSSGRNRPARLGKAPHWADRVLRFQKAGDKVAVVEGHIPVV